MLELNTYQVSRHYSEINGLQKARMLTYSATAKDNGSLLTVTSTTCNAVETESCLLPDTPYKRAKDIITLLFENGFEPSIWLDVLGELDIRYILLEKDQPQAG